MNNPDQHNYQSLSYSKKTGNLFQAQSPLWKKFITEHKLMNVNTNIHMHTAATQENIQEIATAKKKYPESSSITIGTVDLGRFIEKSLKPVTSLINEREITYTFQPDLFVHIDKNQITQCIHSVLNNAVNYTFTGGKIRIDLHQVDAMAVIDIIDNGSGMSADVLAALFDTTDSNHQDSSEEKNKTQLDFASIQQIIHIHGGYITAMSDGVDQGTHIEISLPLVDLIKKAGIDSDDEKFDGVKFASNEKSLSPLRLIVVDDNVDTADSLALLLELKGHTTITAYSANETLQRVNTFPADIILLDIGLPDMDGYDLARKLRAEGITSKLIALTGYGQPEDIQRALDAGFTTHATKPVNVEELEYVFKKYY